MTGLAQDYPKAGHCFEGSLFYTAFTSIKALPHTPHGDSGWYPAPPVLSLSPWFTLWFPVLLRSCQGLPGHSLWARGCISLCGQQSLPRQVSWRHLQSLTSLPKAREASVFSSGVQLSSSMLGGWSAWRCGFWAKYRGAKMQKELMARMSGPMQTEGSQALQECQVASRGAEVCARRGGLVGLCGSGGDRREFGSGSRGSPKSAGCAWGWRAALQEAGDAC